ncbi:hypothetical protein Angca_000905 [Angiostrongylus cantonensis]|nr:hypothetical protein Angca_000905 [Angiostrongylus cantonensis]
MFASFCFFSCFIILEFSTILLSDRTLGFTNKLFNRIVHRIQLIMTVALNFLTIPLSHLLNRTVCTFLTGGLILFHSPDSTSILSSKCFTYLGELSYSLYLVHWPIYTILKIQFPDNTMSLHLGVAITFITSMVLTETFEKAYLRANPKAIFSLVIGLYVIIAVFYMSERSSKLLINDTKWISKLFTPVCPAKAYDGSPEACAIPFYQTNLSTEQIIRINEWSSLDDENQLFYTKCSYRSDSLPWGWCDLSPKDHIATHKILVIGNSFAANQGRIVYESCASSDVEVKIFSQAGCEVLAASKSYHHCHDSRKIFREAVQEYNPDVLFILTRHTQLMQMLMTTQATEMVLENAGAVLHDLSQVVKHRVFVLNTIPYPARTFEFDHTAAMRAGKKRFISKELNVTKVRAAVERVVSSCMKCRVIDYEQVFTVNGTFHMFDDRTQLAYVNGYWHFTKHGLNQLRPFFRRICDEISFTNPNQY